MIADKHLNFCWTNKFSVICSPQVKQQTRNHYILCKDLRLCSIYVVAKFFYDRTTIHEAIYIMIKTVRFQGDICKH